MCDKHIKKGGVTLSDSILVCDAISACKVIGSGFIQCKECVKGTIINVECGLNCATISDNTTVDIAGNLDCRFIRGAKVFVAGGTLQVTQ